MKPNQLFRRAYLTYRIGLAATLLSTLGLGVEAATRQLFVSPAGLDTNPGTRSKPFATLEAARNAVRQLKQNGELPKGGVRIWLRGGEYVRTMAFDLTSADSGTPEAPITYRAYKHETVRLLGGRKLSGLAPVTDPAVVSRFEEAARGHVLQVDLRGLGITSYGELKSRGFGRPITPSHCELFNDGQPMTLARWPNKSQWEKIAGYPASSGQGDDHGGQIGKLDSGFQYSGDRPRRWKDSSELWVHGYWAWDWANSYERVASLDLERRLIKTSPPHGLYGFRKGQRFYYLNVLEELDQPGEWFLDRARGMLYVWPPAETGGIRNPQATAGASPNASFRNATVPPSRRRKPARGARLPETILSLLDQPLVKLTDVSHVTFRGLALEATRGSAIEIHGGVSNRIAGCLIRDVGNYGVIVEGGTGHGVVGCDLFDTGDGGVSLQGGDRRTLTPGGHFVENCHFAGQGRWSKCYVPAIHLQGVGLRASHNLIHDHPHCAILFWGNDHLLEFNEIHHIALETGDVGAIYTGRDYTFRGNRIRHNFIHHTGGVGMGSMGVYMDDCVSGTEVFGNIFYRVHWAMFLGGGRDHRVENNIFVDCDPAVRMDGRGLDRSPVWRDMVDKTMRKRLTDIPLSLYRERYPALKDLDRYYGPPDDVPITGAAFSGVPPEENAVVRNVCVGKWLEAGWHAKEQMLELRDNLVGQDPGLVAPDRMDFRLKHGSPAWRIGFQRIPVERIGLQDDEYRRELPQ